MFKKFIFLATTILFVIQLNAQSNKALVVGRKIMKISKIETKYSVEIEGEQIDQNIIASRKTEIVIVNANDTEIKIEDKSKEIKMTKIMNGQKLEFDSDNPKANEQIKDLKLQINKVTNVTADEKGIVKAIKYDETIAQYFLAQSSMSGNGYAIGKSLDFILLLPKDIIIGKTWDQYISNSASKMDYTYTIKSIDNGIASVDFVAKFTEDKKSDIQGNEIAPKLIGTMFGKINVDIKNNFVKSRIITSTLKMIVDDNGQNTPVEMTMLTEDFYQ